MQFNSTITITDITSLITLFFLGLGGLFTYFQWVKNNNLKRSEYISELTEKVRTDESIRKTFSIIDYSRSWYDCNFHGGTQIELQVDRTLSFFSYICYLKFMKILSKKEFIFFEYAICRISQSQGVKNYLYNLYHFSKKNNREFAFYYLLKYAEKAKYIDTDFYNNNSHYKSKLYTKVLNF